MGEPAVALSLSGKDLLVLLDQVVRLEELGQQLVVEEGFLPLHDPTNLSAQLPFSLEGAFPMLPIVDMQDVVDVLEAGAIPKNYNKDML